MWWFKRTYDLPQAMIDLHNHVAPQIDDGASSDEDTLLMLQDFKDAGFTELALTSHLGHPMFPDVTSERIHERVKHVRALVQKHQIEMTIHAGAEIYYSDRTLAQLEAGTLIALGSSNYYLIEFPPQDLMSHMKELAFQLTVKGIRPILAHPERYTVLQRKPQLIHEWHRSGWLMQLDIASLMGREGRTTRKVAQQWLKEGVFDVAASDMHRPLKPEGQFQKMLQRLLQITGPKEAHRLLVENPSRILNNLHTLEADD